MPNTLRSDKDHKSVIEQGFTLVEMIGVLVVGTITTFNSDAIAVDTVWSYYGRDYGWLPLVIPALALWWLYKQHPDE